VAVAVVTPYPEHMSEVPISEASGHLDEVADESAATGEVIYLTRDGRRLAAIVPAEVAAEIEAAEDAADIAAAEAAVAEPARTSRAKRFGPNSASLTASDRRPLRAEVPPGSSASLTAR
jgi:prevent-host-death family protein